MPTVERFEDLRVWQEAREIIGVVYRLTSKFPRKELYGLADQIQRAAVSTMSNIAGGFESGTNKQFINSLYTSKGSNGEVRSQAYVEYLKHTLFDGPKFHESGPVWHVNEPET